MAIRKIIKIDEDKCNGCGECISACAEGALQLVDGKARLVKEQYCDGFGDCLGECPTGALTIEEREADDFDEAATKEYLRQEQGPAAVARLEAAAQRHGATTDSTPEPPAPPRHQGCPGSQVRFKAPSTTAAAATPVSGGPAQLIPSELNQWPVQLHLVPMQAPFFADRELVVLSTCAPIASADVHWRFIRGRSVVVACPKLDRTEGYIEKLAAILQHNRIPKMIVLRMEVPCCGGLTAIAQAAAARCGRNDLVLEELTLGLDGSLRS